MTWQFDSAEGLRYATQFDAADVASDVKPEVVRVRLAEDESSVDATGDVITLPGDEGLHGDGALALQDTLARHLRRVLEGAARG